MREEDAYLALQRYIRSVAALANARAHELDALHAETEAARLAYQNVIEALMLDLDGRRRQRTA